MKSQQLGFLDWLRISVVISVFSWRMGLDQIGELIMF